jgi:GTPase
LGHYFLRHIERNSTLLFLVPVDTPDIKAEYDILVNELTKYNPEMLDKERMLVISKCDMLDDELKAELKIQLDKDFKNIPYMLISSVAQQGLTELKDKLWSMLNES